MRPGILTWTEQSEYPWKQLWWSSPLTPKEYKNSSQPWSSSQPLLSLRKLFTQIPVPSAPTVTVSDRPSNIASKNPRHAPYVCLTILLRHTDARTPSAKKTPILYQSQAAANHAAPHLLNCGCENHAFSRGFRARPIPPLRPEAPVSDAEDHALHSDCEELEMGDDGGQAPYTSEATIPRSVDLTTPPPIRCDAAPLGGLSQTRGRPAMPGMPASRLVFPVDIVLQLGARCRRGFLPSFAGFKSCDPLIPKRRVAIHNFPSFLSL